MDGLTLLAGVCAVLGIANGVYLTQLWVRQSLRGEAVWEWGLSYYVGSVCLMLGAFSGLMFAEQLGLLW